MVVVPQTVGVAREGRAANMAGEVRAWKLRDVLLRPRHGTVAMIMSSLDV